MEPDTTEATGATGERGPGGFRRPPGKTPVALDSKEGGPSIIKYPSPMPRDAKVKLTGFVTMTGGTRESACHENASSVTLALPGTSIRVRRRSSAPVRRWRRC